MIQSSATIRPLPTGSTPSSISTQWLIVAVRRYPSNTPPINRKQEARAISSDKIITMRSTRSSMSTQRRNRSGRSRVSRVSKRFYATVVALNSSLARWNTATKLTRSRTTINSSHPPSRRKRVIISRLASSRHRSVATKRRHRCTLEWIRLC